MPLPLAASSDVYCSSTVLNPPASHQAPMNALDFMSDSCGVAYFGSCIQGRMSFAQLLPLDPDPSTPLSNIVPASRVPREYQNMCCQTWSRLRNVIHR